MAEDIKALLARLQGLPANTPIPYEDLQAAEGAVGGIEPLMYRTQTARGEHPGETEAVLNALPPARLAELDRYTHGAKAAESNPFRLFNAGPVPFGDAIHGGITAAVFGASELGKALGLGKAMSAVTRATGAGKDINFFDEDASTSPASLNNVTSILQGYRRGMATRQPEQGLGARLLSRLASR